MLTKSVGNTAAINIIPFNLLFAGSPGDVFWFSKQIRRMSGASNLLALGAVTELKMLKLVFDFETNLAAEAATSKFAHVVLH